MAAAAPPVVAGQGTVRERASRGIWRDALSRLLRNRMALIGLFIIVAFIVVAILAPILAPYDPLAGNLGTSRFKPPSPEHLLGTDGQGRDVLSRVIYGARISLLVGVVSVIMALAMGGTIGALAGAFGGRVDTVLMRIVDVLLAIPGILLAIGVVVWLDRGLIQIMFAVALTNLPVFARILRGSLLQLQNADYVVAARSVGASTPRILFRHMLPNAISPVIVQGRWLLRRRSSTSPGSASSASGRPTRGSPNGGRCSPAPPASTARRPGSSSSPGWRSRSPRSASTCSATACANRSTHG